MSKIEIWAPNEDCVAVVSGTRRFTASPDPHRSGWFFGPELDHGTDYAIELNGRTLPDPLARWMPNGVHAPSRAFDCGRWTWSDAAWQGAELDASSVIYELHVGTFTPAGTLLSARDGLQHLRSLGITHVELMPLAAFDGDRGWGYDGVCLNAVHEAYGGPRALQEFVDAAHAVGLAVLLDVVHNHLGPSGNYLPSFGPFFTDEHHTPWGAAVNLDGAGSDDVRAILITSACGWLRDFHLDGLRLDAVHALHDSRAQTFLEEMSDRVAEFQAEVRRPLTLIAESDRNDPRTVLATSSGGLGMTAQWDDDVHHALHWILTGESDGYYADFGSCESAAKALTAGFLHDGCWSSFRGRSHGRPIDFQETPPSRFVAALQNHDQIGNRAKGERLSALVHRDRLAAGALLLLALPFTPMLFMGEEWGASTPWQYFTAFDEALGSQVTSGRRAEFASHGWPADEIPDPQAHRSFEDSLLQWAERDEQPGKALLAWYADLIRWHRMELPSEERPSCHWSASDSGRPRWWGIERGDHLAVANLTSDDVAISVGVPQDSLSIRAAWKQEITLSQEQGEDQTRLTLGAGECVVLLRTRTPGVVAEVAAWSVNAHS